VNAQSHPTSTLYYLFVIDSSNLLPTFSHSISYGEYGGDYDNATDQRFNYELQKMAARGITVLLASGDNGVGCDKAGTTQEYDYPSSPYITMGTFFYTFFYSNVHLFNNIVLHICCGWSYWCILLRLLSFSTFQF